LRKLYRSGKNNAQALYIFSSLPPEKSKHPVESYIYFVQDLLIQQLQSQDSAAISHLYDAYSGALFGVALRIVGSRELAEQVLQDTFVKAWRNGRQYDPSKGQLFTWLLNIARNTAIDVTRTAHYRNQTATDDVQALHQKADNTVFNPEHIGLRELTETLDEKYRNLIHLIYFQGYTQEEAAEQLDIPLGTVKTRLRFAIGELRRFFVFIWLFLR
jgi:RNA polymerase sigma factor (sigma-70 family)